MGYRELPEKEVYQIAAQIVNRGKPTKWQKAYEDYAKAYWPNTLAYFQVVINSDYNDEWHTNNIQYILGFDKDDNELVPLKDTADQARRLIGNLPIPYEPVEDDESTRQTIDPLDDVIVRIFGNQEIPKLYTFTS